MKYKVCMIGPDIKVKGGISSVVKGYLSSTLVVDYSVQYISSHTDNKKVVKFFKALFAYLKFTKVCLTHKPDIVHIHSSFGASFYRKLIFIYISKFFKIPIINHIHGAEFDLFYEMATPIKKELIKKAYSKSDITIVLSEEWKRKFEDIIDVKNIVILENFAPEPQIVCELKDRKNYILFMGEVGKRKGAYDIPDVVENVVKARDDVKFVICGNGNIEKIKAALIKKNIDKYVEFRGWIEIDEKVKLLNSCKVFFLPTYNEGLPMAILEAMAYGLPIVSTNVGGIPNLVKNNENGFIFKPGSIKAFSNGILQLLDDKSSSNLMFLNNRKKVKDNYSLDTNLKRVKELYLSLCEE